ncbi:hypothetical protein [Candidatus Methylacidiphilum infernorum]|uniref:Uncharacterized protein n=1 Tax=Methylacidiphilum infernorum (isolate V4) TaxID=481448 RepID=B3DV67_METI4|nr:hypothetical protein [Candidatus Methylacidiphilum infernorum]ACD83220.1 Hypothetical protein Minf_1165 [Methylacidiphilum infernorum V4]
MRPVKLDFILLKAVQESLPLFQADRWFLKQLENSLSSPYGSRSSFKTHLLAEETRKIALPTKILKEKQR